MPDTERYRAWVAMLAASDRVLVQLVGLAVLAVVGWELLRRVRAPWQDRLRLLYLAAGVGTLLTALRGQVSTLVLIALAAQIGVGAIAARAVWQMWQRRNSSETKGE